MSNNLLDLLRNDDDFANLPFDELLDSKAFIGRAPEQVDDFLRDQVDPLRAKYSTTGKQEEQLRV